MQKTIIYLRQSLDRSRDELGVERQLSECQRLCLERGYEVAEVITDNNRSATTGKRPGYDRLLGLIKTGSVDVVVVLRIDRLLRRLTDLEALIELSERTGVQIATVQGDIDLSSSQGRLVGRLLASVARSEMETKGERHRLANAQKAAAGKPHGSRRPFGYEADMMTIRATEAAILREMAAKVISGYSYKDVAFWLNRDGHRTTQGRPWLAITIRNMLSKPRYSGIRTYHGARYPALWPAIFDPSTVQRLNHVMKLRQVSNPDVPRSKRYLLTGLAMCGNCGLPLTGSLVKDRPAAPKRRVYLCRGQRDTGLDRGCGAVRRNADALDHFVSECVLYRLDTGELGKLLGKDGDAELTHLLGEREAAQAHLDGLLDDYGSGLLSREQLTRVKAAAESSLRTVERKLAKAQREALEVEVPAGGTLRQVWETQPDSWRRSILELVIKKVVVNKGITKPYYFVGEKRYRFDPSLIDIEWRA